MTAPSNNTRIRLRIDIFDAHNQEALVKASLTPEELVEAILQEFRGDPDQIYLTNQPANYFLKRVSNSKPLQQGVALAEQQLAPDEHLCLVERTPLGPSNTRPPSKPTYLRDMQRSEVVRLLWLPALIGRRSESLPDNELLVHDQTDNPKGSLVSRRHAQLSEQNGQLQIELLAKDNPIVLRHADGSETALKPQQPQSLTDRDMIVLSRSGISFQVFIRNIAP